MIGFELRKYLLLGCWKYAVENLRNIVYVSTATRPLGSEELEGILSSARQFNAQADITGVLFYAKGNFFQFLEGPQTRLDEVMVRIRAAGSHGNLRILLDASSDQRQFKDWHMAFAEPPSSEVQALANADWDTSMPITRSTYAKSEGLGMALMCWNSWSAGFVEPAP